jgi:hypothetical protein
VEALATTMKYRIVKAKNNKIMKSEDIGRQEQQK